MLDDITFKDINGFNTKRTANHPETDYRFEVVIASLIEQGYDPEVIRIFREGITRRGFAKEVETLKVKYSQDDLSDELEVKTNREGLYDMLPERIFHQPTTRKNEPDKEDVIDEIKIHRQKEFFARKFFQPFEEAADRMLVDATLFEAEYDRKITYPKFSGVFKPYWPILNLLAQWYKLFYKYCYDINCEQNGVILPGDMLLACHFEVPLHMGNHEATAF